MLSNQEIESKLKKLERCICALEANGGTFERVYNYGALLLIEDPNTDQLYYVENDQGGNLKGFYFFDGTTWVAASSGGGGGIEATQPEVDAGTEVGKYVSPLTLANDSKWLTKSDLGHNHDSRYYTEGEIDTLLSGLGGGAVDSVNTQIGVVVLDSDDISDTGKIHKFVTAGDLTILGNTSGTNTGDQNLSGLAVDSNVVHKTGAETVGGAKTFTNQAYFANNYIKLDKDFGFCLDAYNPGGRNPIWTITEAYPNYGISYYEGSPDDIRIHISNDPLNPDFKVTGDGDNYFRRDSYTGGNAIVTGNITGSNLSGTNTGDETTLSIQTKRPLKTVGGQSIEGTGDIIVTSPAIKRYITFNIEEAGGIEVGLKDIMSIPFNGTITKWTLLSEEVGSAEVDILMDTTIPTDVDTITGLATPTLTSGQIASATVSWNIDASKLLRFSIISSDIEKLILQLEVTT